MRLQSSAGPDGKKKKGGKAKKGATAGEGDDGDDEHAVRKLCVSERFVIVS